MYTGVVFIEVLYVVFANQGAESIVYMLGSTKSNLFVTIPREKVKVGWWNRWSGLLGFGCCRRVLFVPGRWCWHCQRQFGRCSRSIVARLPGQPPLAQSVPNQKAQEHHHGHSGGEVEHLGEDIVVGLRGLFRRAPVPLHPVVAIAMS